MNPARRLAAALATALVVPALLAGCTSSGTARSTGSAAPSGAGSVSGGSGGSGSGAGSGPASGSAGSGSSTGRPAARKAVRSFTIQGAHDTYVITVWAERRGTACVPYARGAVLLAYLRAHPCLQLDRYLATTTVGGKKVGVSGAVVTYPAPAAVAQQSAGGLAAVATSHPSDAFRDLFGDGYRVPSGPDRLPDSRVHGARNDGAEVVVADAWYLPARRSSGDPALTEFVESLSP